MKIEELEKHRPYKDSLSWIKDPAQADKDGIARPLSAGQPAIVEQVSMLRSLQLPLLAKLAVSPALALHGAITPIWLSRIASVNRPHELRRPDVVASEFLAWMARDVRISGLSRAPIDVPTSKLTPSQSAFASVLVWLAATHDDAPSKVRPLRSRGDVFGHLVPFGGFGENAGAVLGSLLALYRVPDEDMKLTGVNQWIAELLGRDQWTLAFLRAGTQVFAELDNRTA